MNVRAALVGLSIAATVSAQEKFPPFTVGENDTTFEESSPLSAEKNVVARFSWTEKKPAYDVKNERFRVGVPEGYSHDKATGLFVWVSPGDKGEPPAGVKKILADRGIIWIGAYKAGGGRDPFDRFRLLLDAAHNARKRFNIDGKRVYIGGVGAGAKIASMMGIGFADVFTGTWLFNGTHFHTKVKGDPGKFYPPTFTAQAKILSVAKANRFVLVGNPGDPNGLLTKRTYEGGFKITGFKNVVFHESAGGEGPEVYFEKGLDYLEGKK